MVLLGDLDLTLCSETIMNVSISNSQKITATGEADSEYNFLKLYEKRPHEFEFYSLYNYFIHYKNRKRTKHKYIIPHFVGVNGSPKYPVTPAYARHVLIVFKPWRQYPDQEEWLNDFENFINSPNCPTAARISYQRVMRRYIDKMTFYEPKAMSVDHSGNFVDLDDQELINILGLKDVKNTDYDESILMGIDKGLEHDWCQEPMVSVFSCGNFPKMKYSAPVLNSIVLS